LHDKPIGLFQAADDFDLVIVERLREEHIEGCITQFLGGDIGSRGADTAIERRPITSRGHLGRLGDQSLGDTTDWFFGIRRGFAQTVNVLQHDVLRARPCKQDPLIGHREPPVPM
jgi:hypothetical protein